jgi:hypothetical protein
VLLKKLRTNVPMSVRALARARCKAIRANTVDWPYQRQQDRSALGYCGSASKIGGIKIVRSLFFGREHRETAEILLLEDDKLEFKPGSDVVFHCHSVNLNGGYHVIHGKAEVCTDNHFISIFPARL